MHRKCFNITSRILNQTNRKVPHILGGITLSIYATYKTLKTFMSEEINLNAFSAGTNNPTRAYTIDMKDPLPNGHVREVIVPLNNGKFYSIILLRTVNGQLFAMKSKCIYDDETDLKDGLLIRDKLICPCHGCEYNIFTGEADGPPTYNSIPIFKVNENINNNTFEIFIPDIPPSEIIPPYTKRDFNDFRKIAIIGTGAAGLGAAETLRRIGFQGEINMFTKETSLPFQKHNLTKYLDFKEKDKLLFYRTPQFYKENDINVIYSGEVSNVESSLSGLSYLQLKDDTKYLYDGLIVASGSNEFSDPFSADQIAKNCVVLTNPYNLKKSQRLLKDANNVLLYNLTPEGLEFASTLKTNRPDLNIFYLSPTNYSILDREFTPFISNKLVEIFKTKGVQFGLNQRSLTQIRSKINRDLITGYYLGTNKEKSQKVPLDIFYLFPSYDKPNINFFSKLKLRNKIKFAKADFIEVDMDQRTLIDNIFAAGSVASWHFDYTGPLIRKQHWVDSYIQGENTAYNVVALKLKKDRVPFSYYNIFGSTLQKVGSAINCDEVITIGNIEGLDFMAFYIKNSNIIGAIGSGTENNRRLLLLREVLNLNYNIPSNILKEDINGAFEELFKVANNNYKSSSFRSMVFENRYDIDLNKLIWLEPEERNIQNESSFVNSRLSQAKSQDSK